MRFFIGSRSVQNDRGFVCSFKRFLIYKISVSVRNCHIKAFFYTECYLQCCGAGVGDRQRRLRLLQPVEEIGAAGGGAEQEPELVAADAGDDRGVAERALQPHGDLAQALVAGGMAESVVDRLQVVEVDDGEQAERTGVAGVAAELRELHLEGAAVGDRRQGIVITGRLPSRTRSPTLRIQVGIVNQA